MLKSVSTPVRVAFHFHRYPVSVRGGGEAGFAGRTQNAVTRCRRFLGLLDLAVNAFMQRERSTKWRDIGGISSLTRIEDRSRPRSVGAH